MNTAAQFSVHRSPSRSAVKPFLVIVQSNEFIRMPTRVVVPLVLGEAVPQLDRVVKPRVAPAFVVAGRACVLNPFDLATIGVDKLGDYVTSFADDAEAKRKIQDALDVALKPY